MKDNRFFQKILGLLILSLFVASCSEFGIADEECPAIPASISSIIASGRIPVTPEKLSSYDEVAQEIFFPYAQDISAPYPIGSELVVRYVRQGGSGDGTTYADAAGNVKTVLDGITDASSSKVYVVLVAPGIYDAGAAMGMKNHVAIIGQCSTGSTGKNRTVLSGGRTHRVFNNTNLNNTAVLYGVTIAYGKNESGENGGGMLNRYSSPMITKVIFTSNSAQNGGGMYNAASSPVITKASFYQNKECLFGPGIYNQNSSPVLVGVTFSENRCGIYQGGMMNEGLSSPVLVGVTFWNRHSFGGGISISDGSKITSTHEGGLLVNTILWGDTTDTSTINFYNIGVNAVVLRLYNSILKSGLPPDYKSGDTVTEFYGKGLISSYQGGKMKVFFSSVIQTSPYLKFIEYINGVFVHPIPPSVAVNRGLYVKRSAKPTGKDCFGGCDRYTYYFSDNGKDWFSSPELTTTATPPASAIDLTATDATGYKRTGRPDLGAYEAR